MARYCTQCGKLVPDEAMFCGECGHPIARNTESRETQQPQQNQSSSNTNAIRKKAAPITLSTVICLILLVIWGIKEYAPKIDTSWAVECACTKVKSEVYKDYGEVPEVSGELIYKDEQDYIVVVKYELPEFGWEASVACHVFGFRESNCYVSGMTKEYSYNFDYKDDLDELKALWELG